MKRVAGAICTFLLVTQTTYAGTSVDAKAFFESIHSSYDIHLAGGEPAKEGNTVADVYADTDVAYFTTPYCHNDVCWQGLIDMVYAQTTVEQETLADGSVQSTLKVNEGAKVSTYLWIDDGKQVVFRNPQYLLDDGVTALEHVLVKQAAAPAPVIE